MAPRNRFAKSRAFTLVELLVVITIIGILASLLIAGAAAALKSANQSRIAIEIGTVSQTIEQYKNDVSGGAYPPNAGIGTVGAGAGQTPAAGATAIWSDFKRHFNKAFPRHREDERLLRALCGFTTDAGGTALPSTYITLPTGMHPSEALVFWMQRFSSDPQYPISGSGGPSFLVPTSAAALPEDLAERNWIGNFEATRYGMLSGGSKKSVKEIYGEIDNTSNNMGGQQLFDAAELVNIPRYVRYPDPQTGDTRQINFWAYFPPNSPQPLVYFDASRQILDVDQSAVFGNAAVYAIKQYKPGVTASGAQLVTDVRLANDSKFQILHCGLDEDWSGFGALRIDPQFFGDSTKYATNDGNSSGTPILVFPDGPFTLELADTIVSFSDKATLEDNQP